MLEIEREEKPVKPLPKDGSPKFRWHLRGKPEIGGVSREPLLHACRVLKSLGEATETEIRLFRTGRSTWDLRTTIGYGSGVTVKENDKVGPVLVPYKPFTGPT